MPSKPFAPPREFRFPRGPGSSGKSSPGASIRRKPEACYTPSWGSAKWPRSPAYRKTPRRSPFPARGSSARGPWVRELPWCTRMREFPCGCAKLRRKRSIAVRRISARTTPAYRFRGPVTQALTHGNEQPGSSNPKRSGHFGCGNASGYRDVCPSPALRGRPPLGAPGLMKNGLFVCPEAAGNHGAGENLPRDAEQRQACKSSVYSNNAPVRRGSSRRDTGRSCVPHRGRGPLA